MALHTVARTLVLCAIALVFQGDLALAQTQTQISTTTIVVSICGDTLVNAGEECDVPGETGQYSTTIVGRQCNTQCLYGPYCGDGILQTAYDEECDDGNNTSLDFCSAECKAELADNGGGSTGGGGSSASGGRDDALSDTQITVQGKAFPNSTVTILLDGSSVGTVRTNSRGEFLFNTEAEPGTASLSFYANDNAGTRSATVNTTFDVTQGAVTNLNGILIPPTVRASKTQINPGEVITLSGQTVPSTTVEIVLDAGSPKFTTSSDMSGNWSYTLNTSGISIAEHTIKTRFISGTGSLKTESIYGTAIQIFVGVEGQPTKSSDVNADGKVNLVDFSVLIFWWGTPGGTSRADINKNGKVGLEDFSILLFNWTG